MNYCVLARKWRPKTFSDVVGQAHVILALTNSLALNKVHHAYLLSGTRGVGKTSIARILAKGLNCELGITAYPCGQCNSCQEIEKGRFIDLIEVDAASKTKVEDTRDLLQNVQYAPTHGRFKVYIIDEIHMLSRYSFNALLKTLEEPPLHVKFVMATTDPHKLPMTILSRCLQFHLKALDIQQIYSRLLVILQSENVYVVPQALQTLSRAANGSMRDALSLADQAIAMGQGKINTESVKLTLGMPNSKQSISIIESLVNFDSISVLKQLDQCASEGIDWEALLLEMLSLFHFISIGQVLPEEFSSREDPTIVSRLQKLSNHLSPADLQFYYQIFLSGRKELPLAPTPKIGIEMILLRALMLRSKSNKE